MPARLDQIEPLAFAHSNKRLFPQHLHHLAEQRFPLLHGLLAQTHVADPAMQSCQYEAPVEALARDAAFILTV